jgi:hypothetical protein
MTTGIVANVRGKLGPASTGWFARALVVIVHHSVFMSKVAAGLCGIATLAAVDVYVGGKVLTDMMGSGNAKVAWAVSVALSAVQLAMMSFALARKGIALILLVPALILMVPDVAADARFPTLLLYSHNDVMNYWFMPPHASPAWWLLEALFGTLTLLGEMGSGVIFAWLFWEIAKMGGKIPASASKTMPALVTP